MLGGNPGARTRVLSAPESKCQPGHIQGAPSAQERRKPNRNKTALLLVAALQYFGTFGSTRSDHAVIPPARLCTLVNPDCCRKATALALRPPILQWTTISRLESSSLTRLGRSFSGIRYPPRLQIWYSCGSRTSSTNTSSFASRRRLNSST